MNVLNAIRVFAAVVALTLLASTVIAASDDGPQTPVARSFSELPNFVSLGDTIFVTDESGRRIKAKVVELAPTQIEVSQDGSNFVLSEDSVRTIDVQYSDSVWSGALIGAAIGAGIFLPFALEDDFAAEPPSIAVGAGIGFAAGAGIDAMRKARRPAYVSPTVPGAHAWVYPILARDKKGLAVALSW